MITPESTIVSTLGPCNIKSPLNINSQGAIKFVSDNEKIRYRVELRPETEQYENISFEKAGPREMIYFDPKKTTVGIVSCGGLSPGLNNVIRSLVFELSQNYGVKNILGFQYGYRGFEADAPAKPKALTPFEVRDIHKLGGSILGASRGPVDAKVIVDALVRYGIDILFTLGGDGTQRGAHTLVEEIDRRGAKISVIGIPKTIDNDVPFVYQTFGFATAVEQAQEVIQSAAVEARSYINAIAIVKLMGRDAGFISVMATLAAQEVDFTLIPEVPFKLEGTKGLLATIEQRLKERGSLVIVVSEGAGQEYFKNLSEQFDASGNRLQHDIGLFLKEKIGAWLKSKGISHAFKYFDPSYSIRAVTANFNDAYFSDSMARAAVHAGMAGKTDMITGHWYGNLTHVPIPLVCSEKKRVNPSQEIWRSVLSITGQPAKLSDD